MSKLLHVFIAIFFSLTLSAHAQHNIAWERADGDLSSSGWCTNKQPPLECHGVFCIDGSFYYQIILDPLHYNGGDITFNMAIDGRQVHSGQLKKNWQRDTVTTFVSTPIPSDVVQRLASGNSYQISYPDIGKSIGNGLSGSAAALKTPLAECSQNSIVAQSGKSQRVAKNSSSGQKYAINRSRLSNPEKQYIAAIRQKDFNKAEGLVELAGINPKLIAGAPASVHVFNLTRNTYELDIYRYVFKTLRLNPNDQPVGSPYSISFLCQDIKKEVELGTLASIFFSLVQNGLTDQTLLRDNLYHCVRKGWIAKSKPFLDVIYPALLRGGLNVNAVLDNGEPLVCGVVATRSWQLLQKMLANGAVVTRNWVRSDYSNPKVGQRSILSCLDTHPGMLTAPNRKADFIQTLKIMQQAGINLSKSHLNARFQKTTLIDRIIAIGDLDFARQVKGIIQ